MIIGRSPLRISLGGGGTDLPSYYRQHGGFLIAAAITKYVYISMHETPVPEIVLRYSQIERVKQVADIRHPIIREALGLLGITGPHIEITSMADIPAGTGLGSSGSFATCLLKVLHNFKRRNIHPRDLAEMACHIEIDLLKEPIGKQDQYIAAFGGVTVFEFNKDDTVSARPVRVSADTLDLLEDNLIMVSTGFYRAASQVLKEQDDKTRSNDAGMVANLHYVKELGQRSLEAIETGQPDGARPADGRALAAQEEALGVDVESRYRPLVRAGDGERRARRQADRRGRRRLSPVLHRAEGAPAQRPARRGTRRGEARLRL